MGSAVIQVEHLRKVYGSLMAVDDVSFQVFEGEIFGLLGPNGAGKTTVVECLQGLRRADGGQIRVFGLDPQAHPQSLRHRIGSQLQESALPARIKVWEALDLFSSFAANPTDCGKIVHAWVYWDIYYLLRSRQYPCPASNENWRQRKSGQI